MATADKETSAPAKTVPPFLRPKPSPLGGVALKEAQLLTHRLLASTTPVYKVLPIPPAEHIALHVFLCGPGFASLHPALDPASRGTTPQNNRSYGLPGPRAARKRQQIANVIAAVAVLTPSIRRKGRGLSSPRTFVDFCGGCGHVGLVLAALYPSWVVHIIDAKPGALAVASKRAKEAGLKNVRIFQGDLSTFEGAFDIGVALHACGGASDAVIAKCVSNGAALAIGPCCVGGVVSEKGSVTGFGSGARVADFANDGRAIDFSVARSQEFRDRISSAEFIALARAADYSEGGAYDPWRRVAKGMIEMDRCAWVREANYDAVLVKMKPESCTPKNDLLVAFPAGTVKVKWELDAVVNAGIAKVREKSSVAGFPEHRIAAVERRLRASVLNDGGPGEVEFACVRGARERKLVHAVAESLHLHHESCGRGSRRRVRVSRSRHWPLYYNHYAGVGGAEVQKLGETLIRHVPDEARIAREMTRGKAFHVTLVAPAEGRTLVRSGRFANWSDIMQFVKERVEKTQFAVKGVGMCVLEDCVTYFGIVEWEAATRCREELGLGREDLHITLVRGTGHT